MRMYQKIWITVRDRGECKLTANPRLHSRIRKAVIKEKYMDITYKMRCEMEGRRVELGIETNDTVLRFYLIYHKPGLADL